MFDFQSIWATTRQSQAESVHNFIIKVGFFFSLEMLFLVFILFFVLFLFFFFFLIFEKKSCGFVTFWVSSSLLCWVASSLFYWFSSTRFIFFVLLGFLLRSSSPLYGARFL